MCIRLYKQGTAVSQVHLGMVVKTIESSAIGYMRRIPMVSLVPRLFLSHAEKESGEMRMQFWFRVECP